VLEFSFMEASTRAAVIEIRVNDQPRAIEPGADVARLVESLGLAGRKIAVERNGEIVPRSRFRDTQLADGDRLEIVVAVGGG
jgi:sulfur carrier protein